VAAALTAVLAELAEAVPGLVPGAGAEMPAPAVRAH
jgi:hypothetical protein